MNEEIKEERQKLDNELTDKLKK
jgi:hypothetical protein